MVMKLKNLYGLSKINNCLKDVDCVRNTTSIQYAH